MGMLQNYVWRAEKIKNEIDRQKIPFKINHENCYALTFVDGLSNSESFLTEAIYESGNSVGVLYDFNKQPLLRYNLSIFY